MSKSSIDLFRPTRLIWIDRVVVWVLGIAAAVAILVTIGIVLSLVFETIRFLNKVP